MKINKISIIGVGYVGLPIVNRLALNGDLQVIGFDISEIRVNELNKGIDKNKEINLQNLQDNKNVTF